MPSSVSENLSDERYAKYPTHSCRTPSRVMEVISRPAGISLKSDTRFAKQSPALYARIPGAAILSISASRKCNLTKRVVACLCAISFKASSTFPLRADYESPMSAVTERLNRKDHTSSS